MNAIAEALVRASSLQPARSGRAERRGARGNSLRRGFTLIELLIVFTLIALMLGIGLGMFSRLDLADRVALSQVQNTLRNARNWAVAREASARVVIDRKANSIRAEGMQIVGTWHFEGNFDGAFGLSGLQLGGQIVPNGFEGSALSFLGEPARSHVDFAVQSDPSWSPTQGFEIRCAVKPAAQIGTQGASIGVRGGSLLDLGGSIGIDTTDQGAIKAWFTVELTDELGHHRRGAKIPLQTKDGLLQADRWSVVSVQYDRRFLTILVDEMPEARVRETAPVSALDGPLRLSPASSPFPGALDNLVVGVVASEEGYNLPRNATFAAGTPEEIVFAPGGALDRARHKEPVRFSLEFVDGRLEPVLVNLYGAVE